MKKVSLFCAALILSACSSFQFDEVHGVPIDPQVRAEQEKEIAKADQALTAQDYAGADALYLEFQKKFPNSVFYQRAQLGRAKVLEFQGRWAEAAELYRNTVEATRLHQPEIAAQALYQVSFCYENLGDEAGVLASLQDALQMQDHLRPEQSLAEIPARMAASYNRMGRTKEADHYFRQAERGIQQVRAAQNPENSAVWLSSIYYNMGVFSTNQVSLENLQPSLDTLKIVQIFSLRSSEEGGRPWSTMASQELIANYRDLWNTIQQIPLNKAMEQGAAKREQTEKQLNFTGQLLALMNELKQYRAPDASNAHEDASELFNYITKLEKQAQIFLTAKGIRNPLTPEAESLGGLKR
jgi:tetratricopeptide (TPR) repeat protein